MIPQFILRGGNIKINNMRILKNKIMREFVCKSIAMNILFQMENSDIFKKLHRIE
jgi:hypothetical protein